MVVILNETYSGVSVALLFGGESGIRTVKSRLVSFTRFTWLSHYFKLLYEFLFSFGVSKMKPVIVPKPNQ
jgi:hypothetical protein